MLNVGQSPLLIEQDLFVLQLATFDDHLHFLEVERFLVHHLDLGIVLGQILCLLVSRLYFIFRLSGDLPLRLHSFYLAAIFVYV